jgi:FkbM family methyltransferase
MDAITSEQIVEQFLELERNGETRFLSPVMRRFGKKALEAAAITNQFDKHNITPENAVAKATEFLSAVEPFPKERFSGRGVVICAGGLGYFARAWVCIGMLRQLGCALPVEVWHFGSQELDPKMQRLLAGLNVQCVDAQRRMRRMPMRNPFGYELKAYSVLHSRFREVLSLDADNVPIVDPTFLFESPEYQETGAIFWPDYGRLNRRRPIWKYCGVQYRDEPEFESGQMVIDKARCWRALNLAWWYNDHSEFFYQHIHGDKDTFHLAWRRTGTPYAMPPFPIESLEGVMCQHDFQGRRIFQHRNSHKWTYFGENKEVPGFLFEQTCLKHLEQLRGTWDGLINGRREVQRFRGFTVRTDTLDRHVYESVAMFNEYGLPGELHSHHKVVDVGSHIGSFVRACHERGSREIHGFEPHPDNFRLARRNAGRLPGVHLYHCAVLDHEGFVRCNPPPRGISLENTGGVTVIPSRSGQVKCVAMDELLVRLGHVTLLKLDCEGSEWPILGNMREWGRVGALCGEYHLSTHPHARSPRELSELLRRRFRFVIVQPDNDQLGKFWGSDIKHYFRNVGTSVQSATNGRSTVYG